MAQDRRVRTALRPERAQRRARVQIWQRAESALRQERVRLVTKPYPQNKAAAQSPRLGCSSGAQRVPRTCPQVLVVLVQSHSVPFGRRPVRLSRNINQKSPRLEKAVRSVFGTFFFVLLHFLAHFRPIPMKISERCGKMTADQLILASLSIIHLIFRDFNSLFS